MKQLGQMLMVAGILVLLLGMGQLAWLLLTSPDPHPNPVGSGVLMMASWFSGLTLLGIGGKLAGVIRWPVV